MVSLALNRLYKKIVNSVIRITWATQLRQMNKVYNFKPINSSKIYIDLRLLMNTHNKDENSYIFIDLLMLLFFLWTFIFRLIKWIVVKLLFVH